MSKPYIVCYMMTSVGGRIDCEMVAKLAGVEDYYPILAELKLEHFLVTSRMLIPCYGQRP